MKEVWKPVRGFVGMYSVSNRGRVKSHSRKSRCGNYLRLVKGRFLKTTVDASGYTEVSLCRNRVRLQRRAHVLVLETFVGPCPTGMECRHLDDAKTNNRLENLCWGTRVENMEDAKQNGIILTGGRHHKAKVSDVDAVEIIKLYETGNYLQKELAEMFCVTQPQISRIIRGRRN